MSTVISKFQILQSRVQSAQFVYRLDPRTLLPVELAAYAIGKSPSTFRSDLCRRPNALPRITRHGGRVLVRVSDLLDFVDNGPQPQPAPVVPSVQKKKRGRPTKAEQIARAAAAASGGAQ